MDRPARTGAALAALVLAAGCAGPQDAPLAGPTTAPGSPGQPSATTHVRLSEASRGRTVRVSVGDRLLLVLHNTYWRVDRPRGDVLRQVGEQQDVPAGTGACRPGVGCGTVRVRFDAVGRGTQRLTASRTTCGEAMACPPGEGAFAVVVVVR